MGDYPEKEKVAEKRNKSNFSIHSDSYLKNSNLFKSYLKKINLTLHKLYVHIDYYR